MATRLLDSETVYVFMVMSLGTDGRKGTASGLHRAARSTCSRSRRPCQLQNCQVRPATYRPVKRLGQFTELPARPGAGSVTEQIEDGEQTVVAPRMALLLPQPRFFVVYLILLILIVVLICLLV
jgi:hypothetical protein